MADVEAELELLRARIAGTHRVLDQAAAAVPRASDYQTWERGLQRLDEAYRTAARQLGQLAETPEWQKLTALWKGVVQVSHQLEVVAHMRDADPVWAVKLRRMTAEAAVSIADLALQLAARVEPGDGRSGLLSLASASRDIAQAAERHDPSAARGTPRAERRPRPLTACQPRTSSPSLNHHARTPPPTTPATAPARGR